MSPKKRILVVDDDDAVLDYLTAKIGARYDLISTNAPQQVIRLAREKQPHLILCDLDMPKMNGGDVSAALFRDEELRHIPLLFLTGLVTPEEIKHLEGEIGGRPAVPKKSTVIELVGRIERMLEE
jgi:CheY-like chemotaxis protein